MVPADDEATLVNPVMRRPQPIIIRRIRLKSDLLLDFGLFTDFHIFLIVFQFVIATIGAKNSALATDHSVAQLADVEASRKTGEQQHQSG